MLIPKKSRGPAETCSGSTAVLQLESLYGARSGEKVMVVFMRPESQLHTVFIEEKAKNVKGP
jgi:hypothetical protein